MASAGAVTVADGALGQVVSAPSRSEGRRVFLQLIRKPMAVIGAVVILAWSAVSIAAPLLSSFDPVEVNVDNRLDPPSAEHWLGVDGLGRDVFTRVLYGGRVSLPVAAVVVIVASIFGTLYGALAGYLGGWFDEVTMRIVDMVLAFPSLILAMAIAAALGSSIQNSMLALLVVWWPHTPAWPGGRCSRSARATSSVLPRRSGFASGGSSCDTSSRTRWRPRSCSWPWTSATPSSSRRRYLSWVSARCRPRLSGARWSRRDGS